MAGIPDGDKIQEFPPDGIYEYQYEYYGMSTRTRTSSFGYRYSYDRTSLVYELSIVQYEYSYCTRSAAEHVGVILYVRYR